MSKHKSRLRHTINPDGDVTEQTRGMTYGPDVTLEILEAVDEQDAKGLMGILDELADECLEYLTSKGLKLTTPADVGVPTFSLDDLIRLAQKDERADELGSLLLGIINVRRDLSTQSDAANESKNLAYRAFLIGASAESAKLFTFRKYAKTGMKSLSGLEKSIEIKAAEADEKHELVKSRFNELRADAVNEHKLISSYIKRFGNHYSERQLRRIRDEL